MEDVRADMDRRIADHRDELKKMEAARTALGDAPTATPAPSKPKGPGRPKGSGRPKGRRRKQKRQGGTRAEHALALVIKEPGIGASAIAKELKIKPNYLYRVLGDLEKAGQVRKDGRSYYPAT